MADSVVSIPSKIFYIESDDEDETEFLKGVWPMKLPEGLRLSSASLFQQAFDRDVTDLTRNVKVVLNPDKKMREGDKYKEKWPELFGLEATGVFLGSGGYGNVHEARFLDNKKVKAAVKEMLFAKSFKDFKREVLIMTYLSPHPQIVRLYDHAIVNAKRIYLILERLDGGLDQLVRDKNETEPETLEVRTRNWFCQMMSGIHEMHRKGVAHLDIKLGNVLYKETPDGPELKISDFGASMVSFSKANGPLKTVRSAGTVVYMAPECLTNIALKPTSTNAYDPFAADIWSLGVSLVKMVVNAYPYSVETDEFLHLPQSDAREKMAMWVTVKKMFERDWTIPHFSDFPEAFQDLLMGLLEPDPVKRITFRGLMTQPWIGMYRVSSTYVPPKRPYRILKMPSFASSIHLDMFLPPDLRSSLWNWIWPQSRESLGDEEDEQLEMGPIASTSQYQAPVRSIIPLTMREEV